MAQLNTFKSIQFTFTQTNDVIYTAPAGYTAIVLNAQTANVKTSPAPGDCWVTLQLEKSNGTTKTLVNQLIIPTNDAANLATGKLVLEAGDKLKGSAESVASLDLTLSFLETLNA
jgi:hypothetical protein